ncbi:DinB family protein [Flagellimonas okinawensis]|uniref:DinB family protein n=1 Tax=Flagellimonas okinawensis TaxID=3031324 RepID=A0ABT5XM17_9FLAO|nr:DinB family protein [[Muricauda] okinawensis]MDF0706936.1 DinB family protein [[Muricauda] okinawensis]
MKQIFIIFILSLPILSCSEGKNDTRMKSLLLQQLKNTHTEQEWFVPTNIALKGLSLEQAIWKDSTNNHSIVELATHLTFWNEMNLRSFNGEDMSNLNVDNDQTFKINNASDWSMILMKLDSIQTEWEKVIGESSLEKLEEWGSEITSMTAHNAYHTGQIIYIRKRNGWWP